MSLFQKFHFSKLIQGMFFVLFLFPVKLYGQKFRKPRYCTAQESHLVRLELQGTWQYFKAEFQKNKDSYRYAIDSTKIPIWDEVYQGYDSVSESIEFTFSMDSVTIKRKSGAAFTKETYPYKLGETSYANFIEIGNNEIHDWNGMKFYILDIYDHDDAFYSMTIVPFHGDWRRLTYVKYK